MLREAELIGGWKVLNWLSFEFHKAMTAKDIVDTVEYASAIFREGIWSAFNREHRILTHLEDRIKKRKKEPLKYSLSNSS